MPEVAEIYLRPLGLIVGEAAQEGVAAGWALPLGGGPAAFTACEIWQRGVQGSDRAVLPAADLAGWLDRQSREMRARAAQLRDRLLAPPSWPMGLPQRRPLIMGVVNVTPDSFSDGGQFVEPAAAIAHGLRLHAEGADIVDVGGESTRPGAAAVAADEEIRRVIPVVEALARAGVLVSIDTRKAAVMRAAVAAGAGMINDISALRHDPESLAAAGASGVPVVLMHSQGEPATMQVQPTYDIAALDVFDHLAARVQAWSRCRLRALAAADRSRHWLRQDRRAQPGDSEPARAVSRYGPADFARGVAQELHRANRGRGASGRTPAGLACRGFVRRRCRSRCAAGS